MFEDTDILFYSEELEDDGYEVVEEDDRDAEYYENEYGSLIDLIENISENIFEDEMNTY